jgi:hypothetical protein
MSDIQEFYNDLILLTQKHNIRLDNFSVELADYFNIDYFNEYMVYGGVKTKFSQGITKNRIRADFLVFVEDKPCVIDGQHNIENYQTMRDKNERDI